MRIAVVGSTGRIGARLTRTLLGAGHQVRALSRGGPTLDALTALGAEPVIGSFDQGFGEIDGFFTGADAAFLMVKTDWDNIEGHYPVVAQRFVDALRDSSVKKVVSLSAMGSNIDEKTGHFESFHHLDRKLNELSDIDIVHLQAAWFMENTLMWIGSIARHGRLAWSYKPNLKMPWVATGDVADLAARELTSSVEAHRVLREVGSEDVSMNDLAAIIGRSISKPVEYRYIERTRKDVEAEFLKRFGSPERWNDDTLTANALNDGLVRFGSDPVIRPRLSTTMASFIEEEWKPAYLTTLSRMDYPDTFSLWSAGDNLKSYKRSIAS